MKTVTSQKTDQKQRSTLVVGMGSCYALGTFTDNFFKQCAVLIAASASMPSIQSFATILYSLPFIICSAWAGWLADRMVKKNIVLAAKITELASLALGAYALVTGWWLGILFVIFFMGLQSTFFSPALNGSIPESFSPTRVPQVNSYIKLASTIAVLAGIACAGFFLDLRPNATLPNFGIADGVTYGRLISGCFIAFISFLGVLTALTLKSSPPACKDNKKDFPWSGPIASLRSFWHYRNDPQFFIVLIAEGFFYGVAAIAVICVANLSKELGYSATLASLLSASLMVGIAVGAIFAGRFDAYSWRWLLVPAALGMGCFMLLIFCTPYIPATPFHILPNLQLLWFFAALFGAGVCGGIYLIPLASFIQVHPKKGETGKALGVSNFFSFVAIALAGIVFYPISMLPPEWTFFIYGLFVIAFALFFVLPGIHKHCRNLQTPTSAPLGSFLQTLLALRYHVDEKGLKDIDFTHNKNSEKKQPLLFLPNHPALIDPIIVYSRIAGLRPRALADEQQMSGVKKYIARWLNIITIPDVRKDGKKSFEQVKQGLQVAAKALQNGDSLLLYPSGRLYRSSKESLGANSAVHQLLQTVPETRVILVRTTGLWGSSFSYADGKQPHLLRNLLYKTLYLFGNLLFFIPKRKVTVEFTEVTHLSPLPDKATLNKSFEDYYNATEQPAFTVSSFFWQGSTRKEMKPLPAQKNFSPETTNIETIDPEIKKRIIAILAERSSYTGVITENFHLTNDLGLDSLDAMEITAALESEFGCHIDSFEHITTVKECILAVVGQNTANLAPRFTPPPQWFANNNQFTGHKHVRLAKKESLIHMLLQLVRQAPQQPLLAEGSKILNRCKVLTASLILTHYCKKLPEKRVGVMLPASLASFLVWVGLQLAGKEPVMLNWTVGRRNLESCLATAEVKHIISAKALLDQLTMRGTTLTNLAVEWILLEPLMSKSPLPLKIKALVQSWIYAHTGFGLKKILTRIPQTAVILFTSGSESAPKGVPLSHHNIIANIADVTKTLGLQHKERILAMLPPFHSFGFLVGIGLPCCTGLQTVYHNNPTESQKLTLLVRDYQVTLTGATPTFLEGMLTYGKETLTSLRYAFVGAEKCPARVYAAFAQQCPEASLCEGYGITECSPVIAVNPPAHSIVGTIGKPLPSVTIALVKAEGQLTRVPQNSTGMLLVRGPSIFAGYLPAKTAIASPFVSFEEKEWYRTGDLVSEDENGYVTFKGRLSRFIKVGGEMISLPLMEEIIEKSLLEQHKNYEGPIVALVPKPGGEETGKVELVAFCPFAITPQEINTFLHSAGLSTLHSIHHTVQVKALPVLGTGKTDYQTLAQSLSENEHR